MKRILVVPVLVVAALFMSGRAQAQSRAEDVQKMIEEASGVILDRAASDKQVQGALIRLLDAAVSTLPQSKQNTDAMSNLAAARTEFKDRSALSEKAYKHLTLAYRALSAGKDFQFPAVRSIEEARAHIQNLLAASVAGLKKGQPELTSRLLLESVIMVVTPISK
jgi:hypothetical protein